MDDAIGESRACRGAGYLCGHRRVAAVPRVRMFISGAGEEQSRRNRDTTATHGPSYYWHDLFGLHAPEQQSVSIMQLPFVWLQHLPPLHPFGKQQSPLSAQAAPSGVHAQFP